MMMIDFNGLSHKVCKVVWVIWVVCVVLILPIEAWNLEWICLGTQKKIHLDRLQYSCLKNISPGQIFLWNIEDNPQVQQKG